MRSVKELRKAVGVKQIELAKILGLQVSALNTMENGKVVQRNNQELKEKAVEHLLPLLNKKCANKLFEYNQLNALRAKFK